MAIRKKEIISQKINPPQPFTAKDIALVAIFVAIMIVFTLFVSIPFWPVPMTFQTAICVLCGLLLGRKKGATSMFIYFFIGFVCHIPVFSGFQGGFQMLLRPTFGYILGFIPAAYVAGLIKNTNVQSGAKKYVFGGILGFLTNYLIGIPYFLIIWKFHLGNGELSNALIMYNLLYMPKDLFLCALAGIIAYKTDKIIIKNGESK